jgi:hypothetical protein
LPLRTKSNPPSTNSRNISSSSSGPRQRSRTPTQLRLRALSGSARARLRVPTLRGERSTISLPRLKAVAPALSVPAVTATIPTATTASRAVVVAIATAAAAAIANSTLLRTAWCHWRAKSGLSTPLPAPPPPPPPLPLRALRPRRRTLTTPTESPLRAESEAGCRHPLHARPHPDPKGHLISCASAGSLVVRLPHYVLRTGCKYHVYFTGRLAAGPRGAGARARPSAGAIVIKRRNRTR